MATTPVGDIELHRPYVDQVEITCPECGKPMHRVIEVIDCWYDSGSMPFAQWHYPLENKEIFEKRFRPISSPRPSTRPAAGSPHGDLYDS